MADDSFPHLEELRKLPSSRSEAQRLGSGRYFTGRRCPHGHIAARWTASAACFDCAKLGRIDYRKRNADAIAAYNKKWRDANPEKLVKYAAERDREKARQYSREYQKRNWEKIRPRQVAYQKANAEQYRAYARKTYHKHIEKRREWNREYRKRCPELISMSSAKARAKRLANPAMVEEIREKTRAYYEANATKIKARASRWAKENREQARMHGRTRRSRMRNAPGRGITVADEQCMVAEQNGLCAYCADDKKLTLDHVVCLMKGGAHDVRNALMACHVCNSGKRYNDLAVFIERLTKRRSAKGLWTATVADVEAILAASWRRL